MKINIRKAVKEDLPRIFEVEKKSYHPLLQATHKVLECRFNNFGIWVAEVDDLIVGFFTCVPARLDWPKPNIKKILENRHPKYMPWFELYKQGGKFNTLWVTSTAVRTDYQKQGIGTKLVEQSLKLAENLNLSFRASALRCQFKKYKDKTGNDVTRYIKEIERGSEKDRFLSFYLKLGFKFTYPLPNYEKYKGSLNYNILAHKEV